MNTVVGTLFDGNTLQAQSVMVEFTLDGRLLLHGAGPSDSAQGRDSPGKLGAPESVEQGPIQKPVHNLSLADIRVSDRLGSIPRFLYLPGSLVVETHDNETVDTALVQARRGRVAGLIHVLEARSAIAAVGTLLLFALAGSSLYFGMPRLARRIAFATPPSIETQAGHVALAAISQRLPPSNLSPAKRERVRRQLRRLLSDRSESHLPNVEFRSMGGNSPNAFALPGNIIVVSDEFVLLASQDDEIAAVLAHELGHLEKRHGLQSALRSSFALLFVTSVTGDLSTLTTFAGTIPFLILQNGYSREFEREADAYAHDLMLARGIPLSRFASILKKLEKAAGKRNRDLSYLSTHPSTDERVKLFQTNNEPASEPVPASANNPGEKNSPVRPTKPVPRSPAIRFAETPPPKTLPGVVLQLSEVDVKPHLQFQARPTYPSHLRNAGVTGEVRVSFVVDSDGDVVDVRALSSTHAEFEQTTVSAVQLWKFRPARKNGEAVSARMQVQIMFARGQEAGKLK